MGLILVITAIIFTGCVQKTESTNVKTSGLYPTFYVKQDSNGQIKVEAQMQVGGPLGTSLKMVSGEQILCNGTPLTRNYSYILGSWYTADLGSTGNSNYLFHFQRTNEVVDSNIGPLLPKPNILLSSAMIVENSSFRITWDAGLGSNISIKISTDNGISKWSTYLNSADDGIEDVLDADLKSMLWTAPPDTYELRIELIREKDYSDLINSAYDGGVAKTYTSSNIATIEYQKISKAMTSQSN